MATRSFRLNQQPPVRRSIWGIRLSISGNHYYCGLYTTWLYVVYPAADGKYPVFDFSLQSCILSCCSHRRKCGNTRFTRTLKKYTRGDCQLRDQKKYYFDCTRQLFAISDAVDTAA